MSKSELEIERMRKRLDGLPQTSANINAMDQLFTAYEGLVDGLVQVAMLDRAAEPGRQVDGRLDVIVKGLDALDAHFVNVGVDGAPGARHWIEASRWLEGAGVDIPDGYAEPRSAS